ncbi:MAG: cobalamin-binding protein [Wenzhouxiangella sp.]
MRIRFRKESVQGSGFRGWARWHIALVGVLLVCGMASASDGIRAISMAPHLTELAYAAGVGDRLVGVVDWSDYPPEASELPSIGDAFRFDLERILALEPDIALAWRGGTPARAAESLAALDIEIVWVETQSLAEIGSALEVIGAELGQPASGLAAARAFRSALAEITPPAAQPAPVFYQVSARPLFTLGKRHVINEVFALCGLENIFADLETEASVVDFEAVLAAEPKHIIAGHDGTGPDPLSAWRDVRWFGAETPRLHTVDPSLLVRPTPRILEGIERVCKLASDRASPEIR